MKKHLPLFVSVMFLGVILTISNFSYYSEFKNSNTLDAVVTKTYYLPFSECVEIEFIAQDIGKSYANVLPYSFFRVLQGDTVKIIVNKNNNYTIYPKDKDYYIQIAIIWIIVFILMILLFYCID